MIVKDLQTWNELVKEAPTRNYVLFISDTVKKDINFEKEYIRISDLNGTEIIERIPLRLEKLLR
jgi:hypothetical protein